MYNTIQKSSLRCIKCINGKNIAITKSYRRLLYVINILYQSEFQSYRHTWFVICHVNLTLCDCGSWLPSFLQKSAAVSSYVRCWSFNSSGKKSWEGKISMKQETYRYPIETGALLHGTYKTHTSSPGIRATKERFKKRQSSCNLTAASCQLGDLSDMQ